jgi:hypothetical protein
MNITNMSIEIEYDVEDQKMLISKDKWRESLTIYLKEDREIKIGIESFYLDEETEMKDIILWIYYQIYQYDNKSKIYQFMREIQNHYQKNRNVQFDDDKQIMKIEDIELKIDNEGNIDSDMNEEDFPISNISYDIQETIEWIDMNLFQEVSLHE